MSGGWVSSSMGVEVRGQPKTLGLPRHRDLDCREAAIQSEAATGLPPTTGGDPAVHLLSTPTGSKRVPFRPVTDDCGASHTAGLVS